MSEYNFEEERQPFGDFDYRDEMPTEEMLINWREANDYTNEMDDLEDLQATEPDGYDTDLDIEI